MQPRSIVRAACVLALEVCVAIMIVSMIRDAPSAAPAEEPAGPASADAVAADPRGFRGGDVEVEGRIVERPKRVSVEDRRAFVLAGPGGGRVLVVPADDAKLTLFRKGVDVVVSGTVVVPPKSKKLARRTTSRTAVAKRMHAPALIKATDVDSAA
jgi:hypothetical protein